MKTVVIDDREVVGFLFTYDDVGFFFFFLVAKLMWFEMEDVGLLGLLV